jgi:hypothetical protein
VLNLPAARPQNSQQFRYGFVTDYSAEHPRKSRIEKMPASAIAGGVPSIVFLRKDFDKACSTVWTSMAMKAMINPNKEREKSSNAGPKYNNHGDKL